MDGDVRALYNPANSEIVPENQETYGVPDDRVEVQATVADAGFGDASTIGISRARTHAEIHAIMRREEWQKLRNIDEHRRLSVSLNG